MILDCAVIGGGPAGLNASLVLGRSLRKTMLFDDNKPRNFVTNESHGFITRDGINPKELRRIASKELDKYPDVEVKRQRVINVTKKGQLFTIETDAGEVFQAKKVVLAAGLKEKLPDIDCISNFYGTSLFSCPFCDGWELRDRPLVVIAENHSTFHMAKVVYNWTKDLIVSTNGSQFLSIDEKKVYKDKGIIIYEQKISSLIGDNGYLTNILFEDGTTISREGGFIVPEMEQASSIGENLGCELNKQGAIKTDRMGRTNVEGVFACGDTSMIAPSQLIIAAAEGSKAALGVNAALIEETF
ncbi:NAD(P)/FAD-dependent oxidoreductase [Sporosarcina sp. CAU 1771]